MWQEESYPSLPVALTFRVRQQGRGCCRGGFAVGLRLRGQDEDVGEVVGRVSAGEKAPGPKTYRETAVCHKWHVWWCERGARPPLLD